MVADYVADVPSNTTIRPLVRSIDTGSLEKRALKQLERRRNNTAKLVIAQSKDRSMQRIGFCGSHHSSLHDADVFRQRRHVRSLSKATGTKMFSNKSERKRGSTAMRPCVMPRIGTRLRVKEAQSSEFMSVLKSYCRLPLVRSNDQRALRTSRPHQSLETDATDSLQGCELRRASALDRSGITRLSRACPHLVAAAGFLGQLPLVCPSSLRTVG